MGKKKYEICLIFSKVFSFYIPPVGKIISHIILFSLFSQGGGLRQRGLHLK